MNIINNIKIRYFRSVYTSSISTCRSLNIISGRNDAGKSNILKALNLFFNGHTDWDTPINFYKDFSAQRLDEVRKESIKGKQFISVEIIFNRPDGFKKSLPESFRVARTWTRDSRIFTEKNNLVALNNEGKLPSSLAIATRFLSLLVNKIHFEYIPAVKDRIYFKHLLARLQSALLEKPLEQGSPISETTSNLAKHIEEQIAQLQEDFKKATTLETSITPPSEISSLFQSFQVATKTEIGSLPLQLRGDGLQARYVPSVLHYISTNSNKIFIWGFEEPENSLEYTHATNLAKDFSTKYSSQAQIFITTHSPAFISTTNDATTCFRAFQESGKTEITEIWPTLKNKKHFERLREEIGILSIQKEVHEQYESKLTELTQTKEHLLKLESEISASQKPLILTEGVTDKMILETAWGKLYPATESPFIFRVADPLASVDAAGGAGGAQSLKRMIESIHPDDGRKVIAVFDRDDEGIKEFEKLSKNFTRLNGQTDKKHHKNNLAYAILLPVPEFRQNYGTAKNMYIEFMFRDEVLSQKDEAGIGLEVIKPLINAFSIGHKRVDSVPDGFQQILQSIPGYEKIESGKVVFAENIVPSLERDAFLAFEELFTICQEIISEYQSAQPDRENVEGANAVI